MAQYFTLTDIPLPSLDQGGGKGLSLIYSNKRGFNVPAAVVLSTEFFQPWMELIKTTSS